jgi:hydrogenase 3 maturation protease
MFPLTTLKSILKGKVLIVGIGNPFRGDDGAGPALIKNLKSKVPDCPAGRQTSGNNVIASDSEAISRLPRRFTPRNDRRSSRACQTLACQLFLLDVGEVPENFLGKMAECKPDTILFVDAVDFGASAGSVKLIDAENLEEGSFSTHSSSLKLVIDYLKMEIKAEIFLLGIQAESLKMGTGLSKPVADTVGKIEEEVIKCMS